MSRLSSSVHVLMLGFEVPGVTYSAAAGLSLSNAGSLADLTAGTVIIGTLLGNLTSSGNISSSGTITADTLDASAVSDTLAAAIVAEIDNCKIVQKSYNPISHVCNYSD